MAITLETRSLTKDFRHHWTLRRMRAVDHLDLRVEEGEIFGLIGPNGAGKTTTLKLLLGLLSASEGEIWFRGQLVARPGHRAWNAEARKEIGFLPEQPYFYDYLTVEETLDYYARLYGMSSADRRRRISEAIDLVHLGQKRRSRVRTLSKGTLQRIGIAQAILNRPSLLILDEPMSGLDPIGRHHMRQLIVSQQRAGSTVIFSSHILPDAEALCTRVGILTDGRLREIVNLQEDAAAQAYEMMIRDLDGVAAEALERITGIPRPSNGNLWRIRIANDEGVSAALDILRQSKGRLERLTPIHPSLEDRFLTYVGNATRLD